ncbi:MAG: 4Fe-4S binding protein, partial [Methanobrevibacter sp.]|nr:4Fe-4S binding protein [Methanobrevibacter sp.]
LVKEEDYCIHCGACAKACPNGALTVTRTDIDYTPTSSKSWIAAFEALKN